MLLEFVLQLKKKKNTEGLGFGSFKIKTCLKLIVLRENSRQKPSRRLVKTNTSW